MDLAGEERRQVTRVEELEEKLRQSEERYEALFNGFIDPIFIIDPKTRRLLDCNKKAEQLTGWGRKELLGMRTDNLVPPYLVKREVKRLAQYKVGKLSILRSEIMTKDGKRIPVEVDSTPVRIDGKLVFQDVYRDITERINTEESLRWSIVKTERKVRNRTAQLVKANILLKEELRKRKQVEDELEHHRALSGSW